MPILPPPVPTAPYDYMSDALNVARVKVNDAIQSIGGDLLQNTQPFTQVMANTAWRNLQSLLAQLGHPRFKKRTVLTSFPPMAATDPSAQCALSWQYYFDGVSYYYPPQVSVLPSDLILPIKMWERQSGANWPFPVDPMGRALDGLPNRPAPQAWNGCWEWREDVIYLPGSLWTMDFQIEYAAFLPDFTTQGDPNAGGTWWYNLQIPVMRAQTAMGLYIAAEFAAPRGDLDAGSFTQSAEEEVRKLFNLEAGAKQRTTCSRRRFSSQIRPGNRGYGYGGY